MKNPRPALAETLCFMRNPCPPKLKHCISWGIHSRLRKRMPRTPLGNGTFLIWFTIKNKANPDPVAGGGMLRTIPLRKWRVSNMIYNQKQSKSGSGGRGWHAPDPPPRKWRVSNMIYNQKQCKSGSGGRGVACSEFGPSDPDRRTWKNNEKSMQNHWKTLQNHWKSKESIWKSIQNHWKTWKSIEKAMKSLEKACKTIGIHWKTKENNEKPWKKHAKPLKNITKSLKKQGKTWKSIEKTWKSIAKPLKNMKIHWFRARF